MNIYSLPYLFNSIATLCFGVFVFLRNRQSKVNFYYSLWCIGTFIWLFSYFLMLFSSNIKIAYFWARVGYSGVIYICCVGIFNFITSFLELRDKKNIKILSLLCYIICIYLIILLWTTSFFVSGLVKYFYGFYPKAGLVHPIFLLFFFSLYIWFYIILYLSFSIKEGEYYSPVIRYRRLYVFLACIVASFASIDFLPNYGIKIYPVGSFFVFSSILITSYAILKYQLLDIKIAVTRVSIFVIVYLFVLGFPFWFGIVSGNWLLSTVFMAILATLGPFLYSRVRYRVEERILKEEHHMHQVLM